MKKIDAKTEFSNHNHDREFKTGAISKSAFLKKQNEF